MSVIKMLLAFVNFGVGLYWLNNGDIVLGLIGLIVAVLLITLDALEQSNPSNPPKSSQTTLEPLLKETPKKRAYRQRQPNHTRLSRKAKGIDRDVNKKK